MNNLQRLLGLSVDLTTHIRVVMADINGA